MAPVIQELARYPGRVVSKVCVTAQHREMLDQVLNLFGITPEYDLNIMLSNQTLSQVTSSVLTRLEPVLLREKPDWVLVQGDTLTVMATALLSYFHRISVGHVEAGLRTHDKFHPFPEEINRTIASVVADLHFAPTMTARRHLLREGIDDSTIHVTGNTVIDALLQTVDRPFCLDGHILAISPDKRIVLVTAHRRENFGQPLVNICRALLQIVGDYRDVQIVYPVHPNPNVRKPVRTLLGHNDRISLLDPLDYLTFVHVMKRSHIVLTDSGGLQEEAPSLGKPVLVLREVTERPEAVEAGTAKVIGTCEDAIVHHVARLLDDEAAYERMSRAVNPYGDGHASERIVRILLDQ